MCKQELLEAFRSKTFWLLIDIPGSTFKTAHFIQYLHLWNICLLYHEEQLNTEMQHEVNSVVLQFIDKETEQLKAKRGNHQVKFLLSRQLHQHHKWKEFHSQMCTLWTHDSTQWHLWY